MNTYSGIQKDKGCGGQTITVESNGKVKTLSQGRSLKLRNHSPDGFNWGYGGSGPAQTALAILLDATGDEKVAQYHYQQFKWDHVCKWGPVWSITDGEIEGWLSKQELIPAGYFKDDLGW
jgi:hypothetical protein